MDILSVFSTSASGMNAQSYALGNISSNIANSTTTGFKRVETDFSDLIPDAGASAPTGGSVAASGQLTTTIAGTIAPSSTPTNMALSGSGYFVVAANGGTSATPTFGPNLYTRRGDFVPDSNGYLVNGSGYYLCGSGFDPTTGATTSPSTGPIKIPATRGTAALSSLSVASDGTVTGSFADGSSAKVAKVAVAQLATNSRLNSLDGGAYSLSDASAVVSYGTAPGGGISGGALEGSNTDISDQFSKMIVTQQAYQANSKALTTANDMLQTTINVLR